VWGSGVGVGERKGPALPGPRLELMLTTTRL
jgi:hypothetical protein